MKNKSIIAFLLIFIFFFSFHIVYSDALDGNSIKIKLKENHFYLMFINIGVSNFEDTISRDLYKKAIRIHQKAHIQYIKGHFKDTFDSIRESQFIMMKLYIRMLEEKYIKDADAILDITSPFILFTKDQKWTGLLRLGFRALENAKQFLIQGKAINKYLFSTKIKSFINAIKMARRAKRFAFLAMVECKTPLNEKDEYKLQTLDDVLNKSAKEKLRDYDRVKNMLSKILERKLLKDSYQFLLHHNDNYGYISKENFYNEFLKTLSVDKILNKNNK